MSSGSYKTGKCLWRLHTPCRKAPGETWGLRADSLERSFVLASCLVSSATSWVVATRSWIHWQITCSLFCHLYSLMSEMKWNSQLCVDVWTLKDRLKHFWQQKIYPGWGQGTLIDTNYQQWMKVKILEAEGPRRSLLFVHEPVADASRGCWWPNPDIRPAHCWAERVNWLLPGFVCLKSKHLAFTLASGIWHALSDLWIAHQCPNWAKVLGAWKETRFQRCSTWSLVGRVLFFTCLMVHIISGYVLMT